MTYLLTSLFRKNFCRKNISYQHTDFEWKYKFLYTILKQGEKYIGYSLQCGKNYLIKYFLSSYTVKKVMYVSFYKL